MGNNGEDEFAYTGEAAKASPLANTDSRGTVDNHGNHEMVQWQASEFIDHQKNSSWTLALIGIAFVIAAAVFLLTRDVLATTAIIVAAAAFGVYAFKKPRTLTYSLLSDTIKIDQRQYGYDDFKAFSVEQQGALYSVVLEPVKRFMPPLTIYFAEADGEKIFDVLARHLPHEERTLDFVENLMRKIRF